MTVSHRKNKPAAAKAAESSTTEAPTSAAEPGVRYHCDSCGSDITLTVRISCAEGTCGGFDLCGSCFCEGAEVGLHKPWHAYRVVEQHAYPIFCDDWGADEELLLIDGAQIYGLGNWADIADHIGNRTKEEVEAHYLAVYVEGRDGTPAGDARAEAAIRAAEEKAKETGERVKLPVVGPNMAFKSDVDADTFQKRKRRRIETLRSGQAAFSGSSASQASKPSQPPKPLVSAPTSHSELAGFMPGRLEFEHEHEQDAENLCKDMEFGKVYRFGGEKILDEMTALGGKAETGRSRMEASGRGGPAMAVGSRGMGGKGTEGEKGAEANDKDKQDGGEQDDKGEQEDKDDADEAEEADKEAGDETQAGKEDDEDDGDDDKANDSQAAPAAASSSTAAAPAEADDKAPDWDEDEADLELKLIILDMYNERLDRRGRRKEFIFERNLVDYRRNVAADRRRPKEERELLGRVRHFAQMQTAQDFEEFFNGLCYEEALRRSIAQLQTYRRMGVTTLAEAAIYDAAVAERAKKAAMLADGSIIGAGAAPSGARQRTEAGGSAARARVRDGSTAGLDEDSQGAQTPGGPNAAALAASVASAPAASSSKKAKNADKDKDADGENKPKRKPPKPLDLSRHPSLGLLTRAEQELCSVQRMQPNAFLVLKKEIITEFLRRKGKLSRREARTLVKMDVNRLGKIYDFLVEEGYLRAAVEVGWDGGPNGVGVPPGWKAKPIQEREGNGDGGGAAAGTPRGDGQEGGKKGSNGAGGGDTPRTGSVKPGSVASPRPINGHANANAGAGATPRASNNAGATPGSAGGGGGGGNTPGGNDFRNSPMRQTMMA